MKRVLLFLFAGVLASVGAGLEFSEPTKKLDAAPDQREIIADFDFSNTGQVPSTIKRYEAACSCTAVKVKGGKLHYEPGESGVIRVRLDLGNLVGRTEKAVQLWLDDDPPTRPSVVLRLDVTIPELVRIEPKTVRWELDDKPEPKVIRLTIDHDAPIRITGVSCGNQVFTTDLKTISEGKEYEVRITPASTAEQSLAVVQITTDSKVARYATQRVFAMVRRPIAGETATGP
jgi:hypothetical protein